MNIFAMQRFALVSITVTALALGGCALRPWPFQSADGSPLDPARLEAAKQACQHDRMRERIRSEFAGSVMVGYHARQGAQDPQARAGFNERDRLVMQLTDCMKGHGFVLPPNG